VAEAAEMMAVDEESTTRTDMVVEGDRGKLGMEIWPPGLRRCPRDNVAVAVTKIFVAKF
jgi:hypothetical protein